MKTFDDQELTNCNGQDGRPAYVAHRGKVVDLSGSRLWKNGVHMKRHHAGADLSTDIQAAPHGPEVLERFPQVGVLEKPEAPDRELPPLLASLLKRYPMLRRHPHPMTVHFPIAFMLFAPLFTLLYLVTGVKSFETTALHCLGVGILFCGVAITTGLYTWWLNYMAPAAQGRQNQAPAFARHARHGDRCLLLASGGAGNPR